MSHYEVFPWNVKKLVRGATNSFVVVVIFFYSFFTTPPFWRENLSKRDQDKPTYVSNTSSDMTELRGNRLKCNELKSATYYVSTNCLLPDGSAAYTMNDLLKNRPTLQKFCHKLEERIHILVDEACHSRLYVLRLLDWGHLASRIMFDTLRLFFEITYCVKYSSVRK